MKRILPIICASALSTFAFSQQQIGNSGFENWEVVESPDEEPLNWNSFLTAGGSLSFAATNQLDKSTDVRSGATGMYSAHIYSNSVFGVIANGNITVGKINMGSASAVNANNYNSSIITDANFSEAMTDTPDSIVFWVKYTPVNAADSARAAIILHDAYAYHDGGTVDAASTPHIVATAYLNFISTNGAWVRKSIPFTYSGPATTPAFVLATFTTNKIPGGGNDNDQVWIDDVEMKYNPSTASVDELSANTAVFLNGDQLVISSKETLTGTVAIYAANGQLVQTSDLNSEITFRANPGVYFVQIQSQQGVISKKIIRN